MTHRVTDTAGLARVLAELRGASGPWGPDPEGLPQSLAWRTQEAQPAVFGPYPDALDPRLVEALAAAGIEGLYAHQSRAVAEALAGRDVAVVTPTASGKSLCYTLPVLQALLEDPTARALCIYPTKALAHDQLQVLNGYLEDLGLGAGATPYDGDTSSGARVRARTTGRIIVTNPDMLHSGILPAHPRFAEFLRGLRYVVVDEMHQYRGVFGSHVANVLRRLQRVAAFHGATPRYLLCSATIANPAAHAERLTGRAVALVEESGAPRGQRQIAFHNPPVIDALLGLRRSAQNDARLIAERLLTHDVQTVVFVRSRVGVELLLSALRQAASAQGLDPTTIRGYRGGYLAAERREIERGLRNGTVRAVVATNALELGVDIGGMDACVMAGYPGTVASTWQQIGRAGRGVGESLAVLVASDSPLDQYIVAHPDEIVARSPEHALINPDNLHILLGHLRCAAFELPFFEGERFGGEDLPTLLDYLALEGDLHVGGRAGGGGGGRWLWAGGGYPAAEVSLRSADAVQVTIISEDDAGRRETVGVVDRASSARLVHPEAIYLHDARQYLVETLDWEGGVAHVCPVEVDYITRASESTSIAVETQIEARAGGHRRLHLGEVTLTSRVTGYRRVRLGSGEHLGWGDVDLPEQRISTYACWLELPDELVESLRAQDLWEGVHVASRGPSWPGQRARARERDGYRCRVCGAEERPGRQHHVHHVVPFREDGQGGDDAWANRLDNLITLCPACHRLAEEQVAVQSTVSSLGRVLGHLVPLYAMCDTDDVGVLSELRAPQSGRPTLYVYDAIPCGVGLAEQVLDLYPELLARADELVRDCPCPSGCPSCIGPRAAANLRAKEQVRALIRALQTP